MPRPRKHRRIGFEPPYGEFGPTGGPCHEDTILLALDEVESLRLMDLEGLDQQACAERMNIGRTTLQRIYKEARRKVADSLINGKRLVIDDGHHGPRGGGRHRRHGRCEQDL